MRNHPRPTDAGKQLRRLEKKHLTLKQQVAQLEERSYLTPEEELERAMLKKKKLATKDALEAARRDDTAEA